MKSECELVEIGEVKRKGRARIRLLLMIKHFTHVLGI